MKKGDIRAQAHALIDQILDTVLGSDNEAKEFYDQTNSPVGRRAHLALAREGTLDSYKVKRIVMIKKVDLDAYLETRRKRIVPADIDDDAAVARVLADVSKHAANTRKKRAA